MADPLNTNQGGNMNTDPNKPGTDPVDPNAALLDALTNKVDPATPQGSLDVLLQDPKLQSEFDSKVSKALESAMKKKDAEFQKREAAMAQMLSSEKEKLKANVLEEIEAKKKEAEEMAKMTMEERYKKEIDTLGIRVAEYEKELTLVRRRDKLNAMVAEKGYDARLLKLLRAEDVSSDDELEEYVDNRNKVFLEVTTDRVQNLLKDHPDIVFGDKNKKKEPDFNFTFHTRNDQGK